MKSSVFSSSQFRAIALSLALLFFALHPVFAQEGDLEFNLDVNSETIPLPQIFHPNIDLSGRGFSRQSIWPQELAAQEVLDTWQKEIGFKGFFRLQYNLWEIQEFSKNKYLQDRLLENYEQILQKITESGGVAIVNIFGTPAGLGKVLDKRSPPLNVKAYKEVVKKHIRHLSCEKKFNIWYEAWSAPDLDSFFLGRKQEYLNLYRAVGEAIQELEKEYKTHIPLGGPSNSWWFQNFQNNSVISPEESLVYELIRFCFHYRLPLDFISWHAYSTDPKTEKGLTRYKKNGLELIRAWLSYFHLNEKIPLIVDEWNFDNGTNISSARQEKANISASFIPARLKHMHEVGLSQQVYFALEDFRNNKENVDNNLGAFWFDPDVPDYKGHPKASYNIFKMLGSFQEKMFVFPKLGDEFTGAIATKGNGTVTVLIYNYIDPEIAMNYLSRNIASLRSSARRTLLSLIKSAQIENFLAQENTTFSIRITKELKNLLDKTRQLSLQAKKMSNTPRKIKINLKNIKGNYLYQKYVVDSSCAVNCKFVPLEEKELSLENAYGESLVLNPYSVVFLVFKVRPNQEIPALTSEPVKK